MAKKSQLQRAIDDLSRERDVLLAKADALSNAIGAIEAQIKPKQVRKSKATRSVAAAVEGTAAA